MTPATVKKRYTMLIEAVAIDDTGVYCEHNIFIIISRRTNCRTEGLPTGRARTDREGA